MTAEVVRLLESGDAAAFAKAVSPAIADWRATVSTNRNGAGEDPLGPSWQAMLDRQRKQLETNARELLARAAELKVDFSKARLTATVAPPKGLGSTRYPTLQAENESLPFVDQLRVVVAAAGTNAPEAGRLRGDYTLALDGLMKFATGWRCSRGVQWISFPPSVADEKTQRELNLMALASRHERLTLADDPALKQLAEALKRFIQSQDLAAYEAEAQLTLDDMLEMGKKQAARSGQPPPRREDLEQYWNKQKVSLSAAARGVIELMREAGIDLGKAQIQLQSAEFKNSYARGGAGTVQGLEGNHLKVIFAVKTEGKSGTGKELSGEYVLAAGEATRLGGRWLISREIRWHQLPEGIVDEKTKARLDFENHVAEHDTLPPGTLAPGIEFVRIDNEQKGRLSDLRGKVVILDFWATWCGPCQEPMAKMQKYRDEHPGWKDRVAVVSLSIDDTLNVVRNHLNKRGWTNTFNVWGGEGGWEAAPAKTFRIRGVPTCYVVDADGKIVQGGHFFDAPEVVNRLLK